MPDRVHLFFIKHNQQHLLSYVETLSEKEKKALHRQIQQLEKEMERFKDCYVQPPFSSLEPIQAGDQVQDGDEDIGHKAIAQGKIGCVLLAAGHGSRLQFSKPKALYPISPIKEKTLLQIFAEKMAAAQKKYHQKLYAAVMVSAQNMEIIQEYFVKHNYFGLSRDQIFFFKQGSLPCRDEKGRWFFEKKDRLAEAPDGNGSFYFHFHKNVLEKFQKKNISHVNIISIDDPLADSFCSSLIGMHIRKENEVTLACIKDKNNVNLGRIVKMREKIIVAEYMHIEKEDLVKYPLCNIGRYCMSLSFIERTAVSRFCEFHEVRKLTDRWDGKKTDQIWAQKTEQFIFDTFLLSEAVGIMESRELFVPVKTSQDKKKVQEAMIKKYQQQLLELFKRKSKKDWFELSCEFDYPTEKLIKKWEDREFSQEYIKGIFS